MRMRRLLSNSFVLTGIVLQVIAFKSQHGVRSEELHGNSESLVRTHFRRLKKDLLDSFPKKDEVTYHVNYHIDFDDTIRRTGGYFRSFTDAFFSGLEEQEEQPMSEDRPEVTSGRSEKGFLRRFRDALLFESGEQEELPTSGDEPKVSSVKAEERKVESDGEMPTSVAPASEELFTDFHGESEQQPVHEQPTVQDQPTVQEQPTVRQQAPIETKSSISKQAKKTPHRKPTKTKCKPSELFSILKNLKVMFSIPIKITKHMEPPVEKKRDLTYEYCCEPFT